MSTTSPSLALLIAPPGRLREGLRAVLANCPDITLAEAEARNHAQTLALMKNLASALVVLDFGLAEDILALLADIKHAWPATRSLVIVDHLRQLESARAAGADRVLWRGFETQELYAVIHALRPALPLPVDNR